MNSKRIILSALLFLFCSSGFTFAGTVMENGASPAEIDSVIGALKSDLDIANQALPFSEPILVDEGPAEIDNAPVQSSGNTEVTASAGYVKISNSHGTTVYFQLSCDGYSRWTNFSLAPNYYNSYTCGSGTINMYIRFDWLFTDGIQLKSYRLTTPNDYIFKRLSDGTGIDLYLVVSDINVKITNRYSGTVNFQLSCNTSSWTNFSLASNYYNTYNCSGGYVYIRFDWKFASGIQLKKYRLTPPNAYVFKRLPNGSGINLYYESLTSKEGIAPWNPEHAADSVELSTLEPNAEAE